MNRILQCETKSGKWSALIYRNRIIDEGENAICSEKDEGGITSQSLGGDNDNASQELIEVEKIQVSLKHGDQRKANDNIHVDS